MRLKSWNDQKQSPIALLKFKMKNVKLHNKKQVTGTLKDKPRKPPSSLTILTHTLSHTHIHTNTHFFCTSPTKPDILSHLIQRFWGNSGFHSHPSFLMAYSKLTSLIFSIAAAAVFTFGFHTVPVRALNIGIQANPSLKLVIPHSHFHLHISNLWKEQVSST